MRRTGSWTLKSLRSMTLQQFRATADPHGDDSEHRRDVHHFTPGTSGNAASARSITSRRATACALTSYDHVLVMVKHVTVKSLSYPPRPFSMPV